MLGCGGWELDKGVRGYHQAGQISSAPRMISTLPQVQSNIHAQHSPTQCKCVPYVGPKILPNEVRPSPNRCILRLVY